MKKQEIGFQICTKQWWKWMKKILKRESHKLKITDTTLFTQLILMRGTDGESFGLSKKMSKAESEILLEKMRSQMNEMTNIFKKLPKYEYC